MIILYTNIAKKSKSNQKMSKKKNKKRPQLLVISSCMSLALISQQVILA